jgi:hypothetical protein
VRRGIGCAATNDEPTQLTGEWEAMATSGNERAPGGGAAAAVPAATAPQRSGLVLVSLILVAAVANLNLSVANVALPDIGKA